MEKQLRNHVKDNILEGKPKKIDFKDIKHEPFLHFQGMYTTELTPLDQKSEFLRYIPKVISPSSNLNLVRKNS